MRLPSGKTEARIPKAKFELDEIAANTIPAKKLKVNEPQSDTRILRGEDIESKNRSAVVNASYRLLPIAVINAMKHRATPITKMTKEAMAYR